MARPGNRVVVGIESPSITQRSMSASAPRSTSNEAPFIDKHKPIFNVVKKKKSVLGPQRINLIPKAPTWSWKQGSTDDVIQIALRGGGGGGGGGGGAGEVKWGDRGTQDDAVSREARRCQPAVPRKCPRFALDRGRGVRRLRSLGSFCGRILPKRWAARENFSSLGAPEACWSNTIPAWRPYLTGGRQTSPRRPPGER